MLSDIYNTRILELAGNLPRLGRLAAPGGTATAHSKLCGSTVTVDVALDAEGQVIDFAHDVKACALGQASSSIMARNVLGADAGELRALRDAVRAMLKAGGPAPTGRWADCAVLEPVRDYKARHASTLLTFDATLEAVERAGRGRDARRGMRAAQRVLLGAIRVYQLTISAVLGRQCRYLPSCSDYAAEAVRRHGAWPGAWMAGARLCRCHPLGGWGYDPVPLRCDAVPALAPWRHGVWRAPAVTKLPADADAPHGAGEGT